ncbi:transcriptional regulator [Kitasatospora purpeofusca]|uniref:transcriptional regulator n=1 Tax=Kitasatospora purpeofusca TaxID=67352 RepID=UPI003863871A|nr:transcriptional regulator [Kitasatospora purpeofusca]
MVTRRSPPGTGPGARARPAPASPVAARAHRAALGLTPEQVAEGMAAHGVRLLPAHVLGWEDGGPPPGEEEFLALARALWCPPERLMGVRPASLRDFRLARELSPDGAARRIGVPAGEYRYAEATGHWDGDAGPTAALAHVLGLTLRELVAATGRREELDRRLGRCVDGRWQAQAGAIVRIVPVDRADLDAVLPVLQDERQVPAHWGAGGWGPAEGPAVPSAAAAAPAGRFWELLARREPAIPV